MKKNIILCFIAAMGVFAAKAQTQIPNGGFEAWTNDSTPANWVGSISVNLGIPVTHNTINKTTDAHTGSAVRITSKALPLLGTPATGFLTYGQLTFDIMTLSPVFKGGIPISVKPTKLKGYYKYANNSSDSMSIEIQCIKNGSIIGAGKMISNTTVSTYTYFELDVTYDPGAPTPDSVNIIALSSSGSNPVLNSQLFLDDLSIEYAGSGIQGMSIDKLLSISPNPASGHITVKTSGSGENQLRILDITGSVVFETRFTSEEILIDINILETGIYFVELSENGSRSCKKLSIVR